ncbi:MAG TPA: lamin tail domain-containing protein [Candidatus Hydrogenedentes bacterium]|nr:lamin tail domain-containing protein [Candidatus Hydrogenedentota bacterium]
MNETSPGDNGGRDTRRGAALIIAIAIMTILLAIALTFFAVTRLELKTATNVTNTVRVEYIADAGIAMAVATLNRDFLEHPEVTSTDHPWRSIYSGAAFVGKPWTRRKGAPLWAGKHPLVPGPPGIPEINLNSFKVDLGGGREDVYVDWDGDGIPDEPLYRGPRTRNWLFIPRIEHLGGHDRPFTAVLYNLYDPINRPRAGLMTADGRPVPLDHPSSPYRYFYYADAEQDADFLNLMPPRYFPFVTPRLYGRVTMPDGAPYFPPPWREDPNNPAAAPLPAEYRDGLAYAKEQVDLWADVDNSGDGLKDSIWIPIPIDQYFPNDGVDNDLDGLIDERQDNAFDDNGNNPPDGQFSDYLHAPDGFPILDVAGQPILDPDEAIEGGLFVYYAGDDGLDNDGDGLVDRDDSPLNPAAQPPYEFDPVYDPLNPPRTAVAPSRPESKLGFMLATQLPGMRIPVDLNGNGIVGDEGDMIPVPDPDNPGEFRAAPAAVILPPQIPIRLRFPDDSYITLMMSDVDVDAIDNDYDLLVNNNAVYAYLAPWPMPQWRHLNHWKEKLEACTNYWAPLVPADEADRVAACEDQAFAWLGLPFGNPAARAAARDMLNSIEAAIGLSYNEINTQAYFPNLYERNPFPDGSWLDPDLNAFQRLRITMTGEPACVIAGRAAIFINDEQSKVNVNVAGAHVYNPILPDSPPTQGDLKRAFGDGVTTSEYETRMLPDVGVALSLRLWGLLTGVSGPNVPLQVTYAADEERPRDEFDFDVSFPGYGRVDDNANALILALNRVNDNATIDKFGKPLIDEGLRLPPLSTFALDYLTGRIESTDHLGAFKQDIVNEIAQGFATYFLRLGAFEGIDEPAELQRFRPLRNLLAERDGIDNSGDSVVDPLGELGDRALRTREQIMIDDQIGAGRFNTLRNHISVHGADRNLKYVRALNSIKTLNKLDYNYATPQQIAAALLLFGDFTLTQYRTEEFRTPDGHRFAAGLAQADTDVLAPEWIDNVTGQRRGGLLFEATGDASNPVVPATLAPFHRVPADDVLAALQTAVDIVDNRDRDHARSVLTTERTEYVERPRRRVPADELIHLGSVQHYVEEIRETVQDPPLEIKDQWWARFVTDGVRPEERRISYTVSGLEAIRINEIMVRPVRRVEAEATPDLANFGETYNPLLDPTPFTEFLDGFPLNAPPLSSQLPEFIMQRRDMSTQGRVPVWLAPPAGAVLGETTYLTNDSWQYTGGMLPTNSAFEPLVNVPNAVEWLFVASEGLPEGRYYLTLNVTRGPGAELDITADNQLRYAIKYVPVVLTPDGGIEPQGPTILADVTSIAAFSAPRPPPPLSNEQRDWWRNWQNNMLGSGAPPSLFAPVTQAEMGLGADRRPPGWVFLDGSREQLSSNAAAAGFIGYYEEALNQGFLLDTPFASLAGPTHTVLVPPPPRAFLDENDNPVQIPGWALCVALMLDLNLDPNQEDIPALNVNFFDFSQEPNHEWVELVNVSDEPVDISGWELVVGIPNAEGSDAGSIEPDLNKVTLTVPDGSVIAPKGMVLLTPVAKGDENFGKWDYFQWTDPRPASITQRNGIGLTRGYMPGVLQPFFLANVTVPPFVDRWLDTPPSYRDVTGNVFDRLVVTDTLGRPAYVNPLWTAQDAADNGVLWQASLYDYIDRDGDGLNDIPASFLTDGTRGTLLNPTAASVIEAKLRSSDAVGDPDKPWDRIIPVATEALNVLESGIAQLVLQGGIFPNYPEWDGIDNDGDGPYLVRREDPSTGDSVLEILPGLLARDMVDNDLSGVIDEPDEGIDEGRNVRAGSYRPGTIPLVFFLVGGDIYKAAMTMLDGQGLDAGPEGTFFQEGWIARLGFDASTPSIAAPYIGSDLDPPAWKAFAQRRWYPGDNVIVSLYEGPEDLGRVADRLTYNEQDIVNRTIDDVAPCPYGALLHPAYPTLWPENQMGLDFYKSLERKHPLYHGDRFGTSNRWEATDGNYDDWAESPALWERRVNKNVWPYRTIDREQNPVYNYRYRFALDPALPSGDADLVLAENERLFRHAISGTPLRMNTAARFFENPEQADGTRQFVTAPDFDLPWRTDLPVAQRRTPNFDWGFEKAAVRDGHFASPGDLMNVPRMSFQLPLFNPFDPFNPALFDPSLRWITGTSPVNEILGAGTNARADTTLRTALLGQSGEGATTEPLFLEAVDAFAAQPLVLTVGQAEFRPIRPHPRDFSEADLNSMYQWRPQGLPNAWAPVYLFEFPGEPLVSVTYTAAAGGSRFALPQFPAVFNRDGLFWPEGNSNWPVFSAGYPPGHFVERWPAEKRVVAYVVDRAEAYDPKNPTSRDPEALFEWGPEDGLENGEYVLYIGTFLPGLREALNRADGLARAVVPASLSSLPVDPRVTPPPWIGEPLLAETEAFDVNGQTLGTVEVGRHLPDPYWDGVRPSTETNDWTFKIEVHTSRAETGAAMDVNDPTSWGVKLPFLCPDTSGYILYGYDGWQPEVVKVRDNYLALRVLSLSPPAKPVMLTHVVLAPRRSTAGRVNVNTAGLQLQRRGNTDRNDPFSPLMGLPGIVDAVTPVSATDVVDPPTMSVPEGMAWPSPTIMAREQSVPPYRLTPETAGIPALENYVRLKDGPGSSPERRASLQLTGLLLEGRPEHFDGRYYRSPGDMAIDRNAFLHPVFPPDDRLDPRGIFPLSNEGDPALRFDQVQERFRRIANLTTTRSDIFEIIVTAQSGYGLDMDGDGFINYRSDDEFVVTAESKVRTVYVRRSPRPSP